MLTIFISNAHSRDNTESALETIPELGILGYKLQVSLTIEGVKEAWNLKKKTHVRMMLIDTVNGKKLEKPVHLYIKNVNTDTLEAGVRCIFQGFQSGEWGGCDGCATPRQFLHYFIVTSIKSPKSLKIDKLITSQSTEPDSASDSASSGH